MLEVFPQMCDWSQTGGRREKPAHCSLHTVQLLLIAAGSHTHSLWTHQQALNQLWSPPLEEHCTWEEYRNSVMRFSSGTRLRNSAPHRLLGREQTRRPVSRPQVPIRTVVDVESVAATFYSRVSQHVSPWAPGRRLGTMSGMPGMF